MKKLPKKIYVRYQDIENEDPYLSAAENIDGLGIEVGDNLKVGLYRLEGVYNAEGLIETSDLLEP